MGIQMLKAPAIDLSSRRHGRRGPSVSSVGHFRPPTKKLRKQLCRRRLEATSSSRGLVVTGQVVVESIHPSLWALLLQHLRARLLLYLASAPRSMNSEFLMDGFDFRRPIAMRARCALISAFRLTHCRHGDPSFHFHPSNYPRTRMERERRRSP